MSAREKSDPPEVAEKRANKAVSAAAELLERRGGAKENAELQSTVRTQSREAVSQAQARIREAVIRNRRDKLTALLHHLTVDVLRASFFGLKKSAAPGVDEMTWTEYAEGLEENLSDLHSRVQMGAYRALPSRRTYIPKADGSGGGCDLDADLRGGVPGVQLRVPTEAWRLSLDVVTWSDATKIGLQHRPNARYPAPSWPRSMRRDYRAEPLYP
jgi:hypothetical protein